MVNFRTMGLLLILSVGFWPSLASAQTQTGFWEDRERSTMAFIAVGHGPDTRDPKQPGAGATTVEIGGGLEWTLYDKPGFVFGGEGSYLFPALHPARGMGMLSANGYYQLFDVAWMDRLRVHLGVVGAAGLSSAEGSTGPFIRPGLSYGAGVVRGGGLPIEFRGRMFKLDGRTEHYWGIRMTLNLTLAANH
jgi:hypothetical protein